MAQSIAIRLFHLFKHILILFKYQGSTYYRLVVNIKLKGILLIDFII